MDEPCSALDPIATLQVEELMRDLKADYTIVIVTHNMQQAARVSDAPPSSTWATIERATWSSWATTATLFTNPQESAHRGLRVGAVRMSARSDDGRQVDEIRSASRSDAHRPPSSVASQPPTRRARGSTASCATSRTTSCAWAPWSRSRSGPPCRPSWSTTPRRPLAVIRGDARINEVQRQLTTMVSTTIATQSPVARDLRFLIALDHVSYELERMGDHAGSVAKQARKLAPEPPLAQLHRPARDRRAGRPAGPRHPAGPGRHRRSRSPPGRPTATT